MLLLWIGGVLRRRFLRVAGAVLGVALSVGLMSAICLFLVGAGRSMTERAVAAVPIDWQVQLMPGADAKAVGRSIKQAIHGADVHDVHYADTDAFEAATGGTIQTTGPGQVVAFDPAYRTTFPKEVRPLLGRIDGVLVAQQTAANLHVRPGDRVAIKRRGLPATQVTVAGVVDLPDADSLFQAVGLPAQAAPQAPPDNVIIVPAAGWLSLFGPAQSLPAPATRLQLHVRLPRSGLPTNPTSASNFVSGARHNLEARLAGQALVADNLGARLDAVREDSLYASLLFLFLGLPGMALAVVLTFAVTWAGSESRRKEQALLRVRGASQRRILTLYCLEAAVVAVLGTALGSSAAFWFMGIAPDSRAIGRTGIVVAVAGLLLGISSVVIPAWREGRRTTVSAAKRAVTRHGRFAWRRYGLDWLSLAAAVLFFWQTAQTGYQVVLAPEGVAGTSVDYKAFIAPALFLVGMTLLTLRLAELAIAGKGKLLTGFIRPVAGGLAPIVAASLSLQSRRLTFAIAMAALAVSFATSTAIFNATYSAQTRIDAELTNGSDATVFGTSDHPAGAFLQVLRTLPETAAAEPMQHRFAYVGVDLQDLYGIDAARIENATSLSDAYFGGSKRTTLDRLARTPEAALVSEETVQDFQLQEGDTLNLRLMSATDRQYHVVPFKFVGVAREFPTAPKDSFIVANASYVASMTGSAQAEYVLMRANGNPVELATEARLAVSNEPSLKVTDIAQASALIGSSLTAVDLKGLTKIELAFAVTMAAASTGLMLALGFGERVRNFTILWAVGANPGQLASFLWSEGLVILAGGIVCGLLSGLIAAWMLVKLLTGIFDPPPETLAFPWAYLAVVHLVVASSVVVAVLLAGPSARHAVERMRDL